MEPPKLAEFITSWVLGIIIALLSFFSTKNILNIFSNVYEWTFFAIYLTTVWILLQLTRGVVLKYLYIIILIIIILIKDEE
jgi:hypothetical protein